MIFLPRPGSNDLKLLKRLKTTIHSFSIIEPSIDISNKQLQTLSVSLHSDETAVSIL